MPGSSFSRCSAPAPKSNSITTTAAAPAQSTILNVLPATVMRLEPRAGGHVDLELKVGEATLLSRISRRSCDLLRLAPGMACYAQVKGAAVKGAQAGQLRE